MNVPFTLVINNHLTCETHITPLASMNFLSIFPARIHSLSGGIACSLHRKVTSHHWLGVCAYVYSTLNLKQS